ncbi:MAG TPA: ATP-binding cassette domain-containing protein [Pseudonocardiaceae bacterium]
MATEASEPEPPQELIRAEQLGLRTRRGWVFRDVDLSLTAGSVTAIAGPAGSGRSMLLLALAGRAKPTAGRLVVAGQEQRPEIRRLVAVARVTAAVELEPEMHVVDHIREADLLGHHDYRWAAGIVGLDVDPTAVVAELATDDAVLLAVALALAGRPRALVVDDVDIAATPAQQRRIWTALRAAGTAVIATTVDGRIAADAGADVTQRSVDARV